MTDPTLIADIRRNDTERLRVNIKTHHGREFVELRYWFRDKSGAWRASEKALSVSPLLIPQLIQGLSLAAHAVDPARSR